MIATIPPLWRDSDAYNQVSQDPLLVTFWGHGPAYSYVAKAPLYLGEQLERWRGNAPARLKAESSQPSLTDSGVWLLIAGQHLALCGAASYFIRGVSALFWVRLALSLAWASNALLYTFAHCVGSESLSMIFVILLVGKALRLVQSPREPRWSDWYIFAILLCGSILSRHLNLLLMAVLPAAWLLSCTQNIIPGFFHSAVGPRVAGRRRAKRDLRQVVLAIAIGLACSAIAHSTTQRLARKTRFHPHSRMGYTFLWRLHFLDGLSLETRRAVIEKTTARAHSDQVRKLIALWEQMHAEGADLMDVTGFMQRAIQLYNGPLHWEELDRGLNQLAFTFLLPPPLELWHAARVDFAGALGMRLPEIPSHLFASTTFYFANPLWMPGCANLITFRDSNADRLSILSRQPYFQLYQGLSGNRALGIWLMALLVFVAAGRKNTSIRRRISSLSIALTTVGLLVTGATCLLDEFSPRFGLPMWELLLLSGFLLAGKTADIFGSKQSAGQPPMLG